MTWGVSVDFGTTFSAACCFDADGIAPLEIGGRRRVPSLVLLGEDGRLIVGDAAEHQAAGSPERVERTPKSALGRRSLILGGEAIKVADAVGSVIELLVSEARRQRGGSPPDVVILTCPAVWGDERRSALRTAADRAGVTDPIFVVEPVAAATHYLGGATDDRMVAVFDFGGGTLDTAVVAGRREGPVVIGPPGGNPTLGGERFDHLLYQWICEQISARSPEDGAALAAPTDRRWRRAAADLLEQTRRAKEALSVERRVTVYCAATDLEIAVTRQELEALIRPDVEAAVIELERTMANAGIDPGSIDAVHLAGGSSRIPLVTQLLGDRFGDRVVTFDDPKYVVAQGGAQWGRRYLADRDPIAGALGSTRVSVLGDEEAPARTPILTVSLETPAEPAIHLDPAMVNESSPIDPPSPVDVVTAHADTPVVTTREAPVDAEALATAIDLDATAIMFHLPEEDIARPGMQEQALAPPGGIGRPPSRSWRRAAPIAAAAAALVLGVLWVVQPDPGADDDVERDELTDNTFDDTPTDSSDSTTTTTGPAGTFDPLDPPSDLLSFEGTIDPDDDSAEVLSEMLADEDTDGEVIHLNVDFSDEQEAPDTEGVLQHFELWPCSSGSLSDVFGEIRDEALHANSGTGDEAPHSACFGSTFDVLVPDDSMHPGDLAGIDYVRGYFIVHHDWREITLEPIFELNPCLPSGQLRHLAAVHPRLNQPDRCNSQD